MKVQIVDRSSLKKMMYDSVIVTNSDTSAPSSMTISDSIIARYDDSSSYLGAMS